VPILYECVSSNPNSYMIPARTLKSHFKARLCGEKTLARELKAPHCFRQYPTSPKTSITGSLVVKASWSRKLSPQRASNKEQLAAHARVEIKQKCR
jgi:hypothetical protein